MHLAPTKLPTLDSVRIFFGRYQFDQIAKELLTYLIYILAAWILLAVIFKLIVLIRHFREPSIFLEITPPQATKVSSLSTTQLFTLISGLLDQRSWLDRLLLRQATCSFEIVSSKDKGIRYMIRVSSMFAGSIEKSLRSYIPGIQINQAIDYLPTEQKDYQNAKTIEFKLAKHFSLPLNEHPDLNKHDPMAYLTGNMTKLMPNELLALQIILQPIDKQSIKSEVARIKRAIRDNRFGDWQHNLSGQQVLYTYAKILEAVLHLAMAPLLFVAEFITGRPAEAPWSDTSPAKATPANKELEELVKSKIHTPLFTGAVRVLLMVKTKGISERERGIRSSFAGFGHPSGQTLVAEQNFLRRLLRQYRLWQFRTRQGGSLILSSSEVGMLYHFPFETDPQTEDLVRVRSRELPAPLSLKSAANLDVVFGSNQYAGEQIPIGLSLEQRQKHMYVIGKTGMGKTTLLKSAIYQDMVNGKGLAVFDPHGDLLQELLGIIPASRRKDVIVFDPSDRKFPIGLNLLSPGINFTDKEDEQEWITSSVLAVFAKTTAKEYWGPRMEHILRNTTLTALQTPNPSLYTLQRLLTDKDYQKKIAGTLKDPVLKQFWNKEFALLGKMQLSNVTAPLTQRLGHFITSKMSRHILLQEKSTISISKIMDEGKILLVNLSKGDLGEDQSFFFGAILTSFIWMAAYQRTKIPESKRRDFFLYVDEFQNFATPRFSEITSEGRKFHVALIASHQNIAQVEDQNILKVVAGNANTIVCLKASPDDEKFILPFMEPEVLKGDIVNLPPYRFFMKVTNDVSENAFSGITIPLEVRESEEVKKKVITYSREQHTTPREKVEEYLNRLFTGRLEEVPKVPKKAVAKEIVKETNKYEDKNPSLYQGADTGIETF